MDYKNMSLAQIAGLLFGGCAGILLLLVVGTILNGFALMYLWAWFIVVPFALPALSMGQAIGVSTVVSFMTYQYIDTEKKDESLGEKLLGVAGVLIGRPLGALVFGRIVYFFTYGQ